MTDRAPRIDTVHARFTACRSLMDSTATGIDLLHALAYSRHNSSADEPKVKGGSRDYALDTHGDPKARAAYKTLAEASFTAIEQLTIGCHNALRALNGDAAIDDNGTRRMHPATVNLLELKIAIDAQKRRIAQGETNPARQFPQPKASKADNAHQLEVQKLRLELRKANAENDRLKARLNRQREERSRRRTAGG